MARFNQKVCNTSPNAPRCVCLFFLAAPCGSLFDKTGRKKRPKSASVSFQLLTFSMRFDLWLLISCRLAIGKAVELDRRKNWLWLNPDKSRVNSGLRPSLKAEVFFFGSFGQITTPGTTYMSKGRREFQILKPRGKVCHLCLSQSCRMWHPDRPKLRYCRISYLGCDFWVWVFEEKTYVLSIAR